jgi:branched-chain amino acid transport system substrate-binding protein
VAAIAKRGGVAPAPTGGVAGDEAPVECTKRSECTKKLGQPAVCHAGKCAALASEDCEVKADPVALESEDTVWFGTMFPRGDSDFDGELRAVDLARLDFVQMMSGYAGRGGESAVPPLALVSCDDHKDEERAARHLVEDVHVPAVIGFRSAAEVVKIGSRFLIPNDVVGIIPLSTSPLATALPTRPNQPRLIWRTTYTSVEAAKVLGHLLSDVVEPQRRAALGRRRDSRVVYLRGKVLGGTTFDELLFMALRFNGKSALENGTSYRQIVVEDDGSTVREDFAPVVRSIVEFSPDVIITMLSATATVAAFERIEAGWPARTPRPHYMTPSPLPEADASRVGRSPEAHARFLSITPVTSTSVNARFVLHFNEGAPRTVTREMAPNSDYDSFYLLAYAAYATKERPITGPALARSLGRLLPPGKAIDVGPAGIFDAYSLLRRGENIDLNGAFGSLDFDVTTGEVPFDYAIVCVSGEPPRSVESGLVFRSADAQFQGAMHCP